ncbi:hypothetical protein GPA_31710 [Gordonibacter pamelaeae 7-10-1-b]|uniref:Uncharacterized protein n=1 Tax=Gordonibacter pamelaeae 7-10-1-b TaxID=657308 RepID=D6EBC4_9ACTN|nr:hypothetical protein GPA_31710 [Gordonibacter pamelaeae 7-10-1-b]
MKSSFVEMMFLGCRFYHSAAGATRAAA